MKSQADEAIQVVASTSSSLIGSQLLLKLYNKTETVEKTPSKIVQVS